MTQAITKADNWFVGEDQNLEWHIRDKAGTPVDIGGWTIQFRMALNEGGASVLTKTASQVSDARCRIITLAADTTGLAARKYHGTLSRTDTALNQVLWNDTIELQARVV